MSDPDKKQIIAGIRESLELSGVDTSKYSDDEIEEAVLKMAELIGKIGVSVKQAADAFTELLKI